MTRAPSSSPEASAFQVDPLGDRALVLTLGDRLDPEVNERVHQWATLLQHHHLPGLKDVVPAYATVTVHYDPVVWANPSTGAYAALKAEILRLRDTFATLPSAPRRRLDVPVCYGGTYGPDLAEVSRHAGLSEAEVIQCHSAPEYRVYLLGFAPGFPYLGGLDLALAAPRRSTPRLRVPAGSIGIAGLQTGIYPMETPGGWHIIGRTPLRLFDPSLESPCLLQPGDYLRFVPMNETAFLALETGQP